MERSNVVIGSSILALGLVAAPAAVQAAIAGTVTVSGTGTVTCPSGYRVAGGGFTLPADRYSSSSQSTYYALRYSRPNGTTGWTAGADRTTVNPSGTSSTSSYSLPVYAVCIR